LTAALGADGHWADTTSHRREPDVEKIALAVVCHGN
jgi:hypothetical protein